MTASTNKAANLRGRSFVAVVVPILVALGIAGCGTQPAAADGDETKVPDNTAALEALTENCNVPEGLANNPKTIADVVTMINAMDPSAEIPVTLHCFLVTLQRPLRINGTRSVLSAQPAVGPKNPRIFLLTNDLLLSVVPAGFGRPFLELGQLTSPKRSIKAEIKFPIEAPLTDESPYKTLAYGPVTTCGLCHRDEKPMFGIPNAVESTAFRPKRNLEVPLEDILKEYTGCDADADPERCELLQGLFGHGPVAHDPFPEEMPTIFDE